MEPSEHISDRDKLTTLHLYRFFTDLPVDHVTHSHSNPHACSLDMIVVEMLEDSQSKRGDGHRSSVNIRHAKTSLIIGVTILKEKDYLPQKKWLDHFDCLLYDKDNECKLTFILSQTLGNGFKWLLDI